MLSSFVKMLVLPEELQRSQFVGCIMEGQSTDLALFE